MFENVDFARESVVSMKKGFAISHNSQWECRTSRLDNPEE